MRLFGNYGTIRVGAFDIVHPFSEWYWNCQWIVNYKMANGKLLKTIKISNEDASTFFIKGNCTKGKMSIRISQDNIEKTYKIPDGFNDKIDMTDFNAGLIKMVLVLESIRNAKVKICWRNKRGNEYAKDL